MAMADLPAEEGEALNGSDSVDEVELERSARAVALRLSGANQRDMFDDNKVPPNQNHQRHSSVSMPLNNGAGYGRRMSNGGIVFHQYHPTSALALDVTHGGGSNLPNEFREAITLPQSTHTLLFTEDILSVPFGFAFLILATSIVCLSLALSDNLIGTSAENPLNVPANISNSVRAAQYFSLLVAILMEDEIPTGLYLLRVIPKSVVEKLGFSYGKFVVSAMCRLVIGYMFLVNVFLVIVQSERVLDMFYDMLALNFVSMVDDISFRLAQLDILGKRLRLAASAPSFQTEFERKPYVFRRKMTIFVKFVFFFNFLLMLACIIAVGVRQETGHYQCSSITVTLGEDIWQNAWVTTPDGQLKSMVLVYSFFNGVYKKNGTHAGRPVYREMRKSSESPFETQIGAEIKYCPEEGAWVLSHENIKKTQSLEESSCPWLLRSPDTQAYDLKDVSREWEIWVGVINQGAKMDFTCNECQSNTDCNLNGVCTDDKKCACAKTGYFGMHCELETPCSRIISDITNTTWSVTYTRQCEIIHEYGRPVYTLDHMSKVTGAPIDVDDDDRLSLVYSGSRWVGMKIGGSQNISTDQPEGFSSDFHAFWDKAHSENEKMVAELVSDPTMGSTPVGVDFYRIGNETGEQYGPFGVLYPLQDPPGRHPFRCDDTVTKAILPASCRKAE